MRAIPQEVIDSWPDANYIDPETRGPGLVIAEAIALSVAMICLALRMYVRVVLMRNTGLDDWVMVAAMIFGIALTVSAILASTHYGWDRHVWDLKPAQQIQGRQISLAIQALFVVSSALAKVSIIISYLRLAPLNSWFRRMCHGSIWLVIVSNSTLFIVLWTQCRPLSDYWNIFNPKNNCIPEAPPLLFQSIMTVLTDFLVWALPLWTLYHARLPLSQRIALIVLFSFGLFVCVAGCVRTYWIYYIIESTFDPTWQGIHLWIWTAVEIHLGVICGCVPWLKSLVKYRKGTTIDEPTHGISSGAVGTGGAGPGGSKQAHFSSQKSPAMSRRTHDDAKWLAEASDTDDGAGVELESYGNKSRGSSSTQHIVSDRR